VRRGGEKSQAGLGSCRGRSFRKREGSPERPLVLERSSYLGENYFLYEEGALQREKTASREKKRKTFGGQMGN